MATIKSGLTLQVGAVSDVELRLLMRFVDKDHSGSIQFEELSKALMPR